MINTSSLMKYLLTLLLLLPGALHAAETMVRLDDGTDLKVFVFYPKEGGDGPWPLCVLMPGGGANEYLARAQFWLGHELAERGWAIAVPVSPDDKPFFGSNAEKIPKAIARLQRSPKIMEGPTLLVGVSNGGSSALEIASQDPDKYLGVVAVPGIIKRPHELKDLNGLPVYLRIGSKDPFRWHEQLPGLTADLTAAGAQVDAALMPDASHLFKIDWENLQPWLKGLEKR